MSDGKFSCTFTTTVLLSFMFAAIGSVGGQDTKMSTQEQSRPRKITEPPQQSTPTLKRPNRNDKSNDQADDVVRIETDLTNVFFTAVDKNKRFITTLKQEDIRVLEDGVAQEIFTFQRETDRPLSLAILVDVSASQQLTLEDEKDAARNFVNAVVHHAKDEVAVISFSGEATVEQGLTNRLSSVQQALKRIEIYSPSNKKHDGSYRKVEIELVNPEVRKQKLVLNYRQGYFAKSTSRRTSQ